MISIKDNYKWINLYKNPKELLGEQNDIKWIVDD